MAGAGAEPRWWLTGHQSCTFCLQRYCVLVEYRCVACDAPVCPLCVMVVRVRREAFCPECREGED